MSQAIVNVAAMLVAFVLIGLGVIFVGRQYDDARNDPDPMDSGQSQKNLE